MPPGPEPTRPALTADSFTASDGMKLPLRSWGTDNDHPKAVILALHGMGDYSNFIALPAADWAKHGIVTLSFDQRGFGGAPYPGMWAGGDVMRRDYAEALAATRARYPTTPVLALGESMGGAVVLSSLAQPNPPRPDGTILIAPAVWSREDMPIAYRTVAWLAAHIAPDMRVSGNGVVHIWPSDNVPMLRAYSRDPLVQKRTRADAVYGLINLMDDARHAPEHIASAPPILLLYGKNDQVIPAPPTEAVVAALGSKAEVHRYEHGYHMLLRDLEGPSIWQDIRQWIEKGGK
ncbi:MAG: lysophospholipase [Alphaproteobacteria bacterium]|nr:lysophospholipase [Alphaproteobacteria bacterium]MBV9905545.1 lysophospholipase [Alphaproteobacteria bacterium]